MDGGGQIVVLDANELLEHVVDLANDGLLSITELQSNPNDVRSKLNHCIARANQHTSFCTVAEAPAFMRRVLRPAPALTSVVAGAVTAARGAMASVVTGTR